MLLLRLFMDICLFRKGPQDVPASTLLLGLSLTATLLASILLGTLEVDLLQAILQALAASGILASFVFLMLRLTGYGRRFLPTVTAAVACDGLITALAIPVSLLSLWMPDMQEYGSILFSVLLLWETAVMGHILKSALNLPVLSGMFLALLYMYFSLRIMMALFPPMH